MFYGNILVGALIGVAMSVPVGPGGVICVKRIISRGFLAGLASGFGVALGDMLFATLVVAGISSVSEFLVRNARIIQMIGATIIIIVGAYGLKKGPKLSSDPRGNLSLAAVKDFTSMLAITLANPQTIIGFSTSFAAMVAFYQVDTRAQIVELVGGVFTGSLAMWIFLSWLVSHWRGIMEDALIARLHRYASYFVIFIGVVLLVYALLLGSPIKLS